VDFVNFKRKIVIKADGRQHAIRSRKDEENPLPQGERGQN